MTYRVEIYNVFKRFPDSRREYLAGTGWLVAEVLANGCRRGTYAWLGVDGEDIARDLVRILNSQAENFV